MAPTVFIAIIGIVFLVALGLGIWKSVQISKGASTHDRTGSLSGAGLQRIVFFSAAGLLFLLGLIIAFFAMFYTNPVNTAKVFVSFDGRVQKVVTAPGAGFHAPWTKVVEFDLASQKLTFAGDGKGTPSYTGGQVNGQQITAAVQGGATSNFDINFTYNIEPGKVKKIYEDYRSQENFSSQVIVPQVISSVRKVPAQYDAISFRGDKQGEAQDTMIESANKSLKPYGVKITVGALNNITYSDDVEQSIKNVLVAQQKQQQAEAELKATEISAQQQVVEAKAEADANREIAKSLTPEVLQSKQLDTLKDLGKNGNTFIVPNGSNPLIQVPAK